jgi:uncharacterized protein GlcG (DUF336 family)
MRLRILAGAILAAVMLVSASSQAQAPTPPDRNAIPDKIPFDIPYGAPISADQAEALIRAAVVEAKKHNWKVIVAVVDSGANLVAFERMDGAQLASIAVSQHKARAAVIFRRETRVYEDSVQNGLTQQLTIDDIIAARGGIPLLQDGKIVGGIGVSGGTGSQDEVIAKAVVAAFNK